MRRIAAGSARWLVTLALVGLPIAGCGAGGGGTSTPPPASTASGSGAGATGATSPINLNWDPKDSCVTFVPPNPTIHVGDRVQFNTSMDGTVMVMVPAGLFSAGDTTFVVVRGANAESPQAKAIGTYPLTSSPRACASKTAGGGPSITVDGGDTGGKP